MLRIYVIDVSNLNNDSLFDYHFNRTSPFRQNKVNSYKFRKDKNLSLGASILLDIELKKHGYNEQDINYKLSEYGKPSFKEIPELSFSISHAGTYSVVAFSNKNIGCDIEQIVNMEESAKKLCVSENEQLAIKNNKDFFFLWSTKESYLKAEGKGIISDLTQISEGMIQKEYQVSKLGIIAGYSLVVCHKEKQDIINPIIINPYQNMETGV